LGLGFGFQQRFKAGFVLGYAWVGFALQGFFEDSLPCIDVGSDVVESASVDLDVYWRIWRAV
jgi:hypothetical protein